MKPPAGISRDTWKKLPLAKRRLALEGPLQRDQAGIRDAVLVIAGELARAGADEETALEAARAMPLDVPFHKERRYRRQFPDFVRWAYHPPDGLPLLTSCPGAPNHTGDKGTTRLREAFAPYCDEECAQSCRIRRASHNPAGVLLGSPFENVWQSSLWVAARGDSRGLGPAGKAVYELLAALATPNPDEPIQASRRYLSVKLGHTVAQRSIGDLLDKMRSLGLLTRTNKRHGLYRVHTLTADQVAAIEEHLGTTEIVQGRKQEVEQEWTSYREWLVDEGNEPLTLEEQLDEARRIAADLSEALDPENALPGSNDASPPNNS